jgi:hypothetical protein
MRFLGSTSTVRLSEASRGLWAVRAPVSGIGVLSLPPRVRVQRPRRRGGHYMGWSGVGWHGSVMRGERELVCCGMVVVPVVGGSSPIRHPSVAGPCSSVDRAAAFEAACGGSTPPRAITAAAPDGRACVPCLKFRFRVKGGVSEGVAHSTSLSRETPVFDLWGNHQAPVVQHHPFSPLPQRTRPDPGLRLAGGSHAFD